jgi:hypothetical protein
MTYLKNNILTIILCLALGLYIWRSNTLKYQRDNIESKVLKEFVITHLKELDKQLDEVQLKSTADSIARNEVIRNLPRYENNLSHTRLIAIRDSIRARNLLNR